MRSLCLCRSPQSCSRCLKFVASPEKGKGDERGRVGSCLLIVFVDAMLTHDIIPIFGSLLVDGVLPRSWGARTVYIGHVYREENGGI